MRQAVVLYCVLIVCGGAVSVVAQPFQLIPVPFLPAETEAMQRTMSNYTGFKYTISQATPSDSTPNGNIKQNQVGNNPFLSTLPGTGNAQTVVTMGPCAGNTPHVHPRGSEISFLLYGNITFGMIEENANSNNPVIVNMTAGDTVHIPTGIMHFSINNQCEPAAFLANFGVSDPGTQTIWNSFIRIPSDVLNAATGLPEAQINELKLMPLVTPPGTGGEECLQRCGLNFTTANNLTESAAARASNLLQTS
ncbi:hypothetical protein ABBQ32_001524 [Trebouxia sp. C0010 RCD-2024]